RRSCWRRSGRGGSGYWTQASGAVLIGGRERSFGPRARAPAGSVPPAAKPAHPDHAPIGHAVGGGWAGLARAQAAGGGQGAGGGAAGGGGVGRAAGGPPRDRVAAVRAARDPRRGVGARAAGRGGGPGGGGAGRSVAGGRHRRGGGARGQPPVGGLGARAARAA